MRGPVHAHIGAAVEPGRSVISGTLAALYAGHRWIRYMLTAALYAQLSLRLDNNLLEACMRSDHASFADGPRSLKTATQGCPSDTYTINDPPELPAHPNRPPGEIRFSATAAAKRVARQRLLQAG